MPIYLQSYRTYEGQARGSFRWLTMVRQEWRVLIKVRTFQVVIVLGYLHACLRLLQVVAYDTVASDPNSPMYMILQRLQALVVDERMFFDFLRMQGGLVFVATILAGAGIICDDVKNNLMEVYFSKPLTWRDYVVGKVVAVVCVGLVFTAVPALLCLVLHNMLVPSIETVRATYWIGGSILAFSFLMVLPCALGVLASSALSRSGRYASIAVFTLLFGNLLVGQMVKDLLHQADYSVVALPLAINRVGTALFAQRGAEWDALCGWSALYVVAVCAVCLWIVCRKVRREEVAA